MTGIDLTTLPETGPAAARQRRLLTLTATVAALFALTAIVHAPAAYAAAPSNDDFAAAKVVGPTLPASVDGSTTAATAQSGEPKLWGAARTSVWYSWTAPSSQTVRVRVVTPGSDEWRPVLAAYTGSALTGLTRIAANEWWFADYADDDSCCDPGLVVQAVAGTTYRFAVDSTPGHGTGDFTLTIGAETKYGAIRGKVTPPAGALQTSVYLHSAGTTGTQAASITTLPDGSYSLDGIAPGKYTLMAVAHVGSDSQALRWYGDVNSRAESTVVTVTAGGVLTGKNISFLQATTKDSPACVKAKKTEAAKLKAYKAAKVQEAKKRKQLAAANKEAKKKGTAKAKAAAKKAKTALYKAELASKAAWKAVTKATDKRAKACRR